MTAVPCLVAQGQFERAHVCGECRRELAARGAHVVPGPHVLDLDTRCEAHARTGALMAQHVIDVPPDLWASWRREQDAEPIAPLRAELGDVPGDANRVAKLACALLAGGDANPSFDAISLAVRTARRVLAAARGL